MFKKILLLLPLLCLSACNFHLRGPVTLAEPLHNMYIQSEDPYGSLMRHLKQNLRMSGVHLADSPSEASTILHILRENTGQELLSINSSQQTRQYRLVLSVTFEVFKARGKVSLPAQTVTETRPLTLQSNQILAGSNQAAQLFSDMRRGIVYDLMTRLSSPAVTQALTP